ncbi:unnamed protein product [Caenorhabditis bovis]|uniref:Uncharacterized protein n=1 Tax=Caenorhabditis bovis TaxID=2654633 RepID=A0A8S1EPQ7_9PELO|nr:unnamed protein product [Caenorhabditis bovis]
MDEPDSGTEPILDEPMETSWPTTPSSGILHSDDNSPLEAGVVTDEPENETSAFEVSFTFQLESLPCPTSPAFCGVSEGNAVTRPEHVEALHTESYSTASSQTINSVILVGNANIIGEAGYWSEIFRTCRYAQTILTESQLPETQ